MFPSYSDPREARVQRFDFDDKVKEKILSQDRCFIIGLGPSLAKVAPEGLKDEFVIGTNYILRTDVVPDVICMVDNRRYDYENWLRTQIKLITVKQIAERRSDTIGNLNAYHDIDYIDYGSGLTRDVLTIDSFDDQFSMVHFAGSVITDLAIPFATYLGFKNVYVLGLDGALASFPSTHIFGNEKKYAAAHPSHMYHLHEKTAALALKRGVRTFNASPGGVVFALEKTSLAKTKISAVRTDFDRNVDGHFVVLGTGLIRLVAQNGGYRLVTEDGARYIRHKNNVVFLDRDDGSSQFGKDSTWYIEPAFGRQGWASFRSVNAKDKYITALDEFSGYKLRSMNGVFSPYFSSFRVYEDRHRAAPRIANNMILKQIAEMKHAVGGSMLADDGY